jgi:hypothetical protein
VFATLGLNSTFFVAVIGFNAPRPSFPVACKWYALFLLEGGSNLAFPVKRACAGNARRLRVPNNRRELEAAIFVIDHDKLTMVLSSNPTGALLGQWYTGHIQYIFECNAKFRGATGTS